MASRSGYGARVINPGVCRSSYESVRLSHLKRFVFKMLILVARLGMMIRRDNQQARAGRKLRTKGPQSKQTSRSEMMDTNE